MKSKLIALCMAVALCAGCQEPTPEQIRTTQSEQTPILICSKDGVKVYKVRDLTPGGRPWIYFTVPDGHLVDGNK